MAKNIYQTRSIDAEKHIGKKKINCCPSKVYSSILAELAKDCKNLKSMISSLAREEDSGDTNRSESTG
jgi:hypothetical protein